MEPNMETCCKKEKTCKNCFCLWLIVEIVAIILSFFIGVLVAATTGIITALGIGVIIALVIELAVLLIISIITLICCKKSDNKKNCCY